jgi:sulfur carrier protein ThiS
VEIKLTLHGILRDYLPRQAKGKTTLNLPEGANINDIVQQLNLKHTVSAAVGGVQVENNYVLRDGDDLQLFRPIGGG